MADDPGRSTLPLPDYDQLPLGSLEGRVRSLSAEEVEELLAYERTHADRPSTPWWPHSTRTRSSQPRTSPSQGSSSLLLSR
ncbi:hypothetical protein ABT317_28905, partial [Streptomyces carpinensis]